jgi:hypothetical protein
MICRNQINKMIKFLIVLIFNLNYITSQYYQPPSNDYDSSNKQQPVKLDNIEQKYVNSGQSVLLVCDLPNSLPDGKVSINLFLYE